MLIFHVLRERGIWYLVLYDLGIFQVRLDVLILEKFENLQACDFATLKIVHVFFSGNQTMVACVHDVGSQHPWSFLQGSLIP